jgi:hypothetical protein
MLFQLLDQLANNPADFPVILASFLATVALGLIVALTVHEFSHAAVATSLGDETPRREGRLSLNPIRHLDPFGTFLLMVAGFGWGKPVRVNPYALQGGPGPRGGMALVAAAGPLSNLLMATLLALPVRLGLLPWHSPFRYPPFLQREPMGILADIIGWLILHNVFLGIQPDPVRPLGWLTLPWCRAGDVAATSAPAAYGHVGVDGGRDDETSFSRLVCCRASCFPSATR